jgi:hypothetical protein
MGSAKRLCHHSKMARRLFLNGLGGLERAKGIEPSYAAWEAAIQLGQQSRRLAIVSETPQASASGTSAAASIREDRELRSTASISGMSSIAPTSFARMIERRYGQAVAL